MSQSLVKNLVHLVDSTKNRQPRVPNDLRAGLFAYPARILLERACFAPSGLGLGGPGCIPGRCLGLKCRGPFGARNRRRSPLLSLSRQGRKIGIAGRDRPKLRSRRGRVGHPVRPGLPWEETQGSTPDSRQSTGVMFKRTGRSEGQYAGSITADAKLGIVPRQLHVRQKTSLVMQDKGPRASAH